MVALVFSVLRLRILIWKLKATYLSCFQAFLNVLGFARGQFVYVN